MPKGDKYYDISNRLKDKYNIPEEYLTNKGRINKKKKEKVLEYITDEEDKKEYMDIFGINININEVLNDTESNSDLSDEQVNDIVDGEDNNNDNSLDNDNIKECDIDIKNKDGLEYLTTIDNNSINLVLTDPPYITSTKTGMGDLHKKIKKNKENGIEYVKTEQEWDSVKDKYIGKKNMEEEIMKVNFMKYGSIFGSKYSVQTEYGEWDSNFTMEILDKFIGEYYKKLKKGGTLIIFFDLWKISPLKELMEKHKFKQIRFIEWIKTNPQPLNSQTNYLTNCREIALLGVKGGSPTFNSKYDNAIYKFPLQGGKRFHPTTKSLLLFEELIKKHSNENDIILDTFLGSGTTARACKNTNRKFRGCEVSKEYYDKMMELI